MNEPTNDESEIIADLSMTVNSLIPFFLEISLLNSSRMVVNDEYGSLTFIRVVLICSVGSKSSATIAAEAFVEYMNSVYFGFARNVSEP